MNCIDFDSNFLRFHEAIYEMGKGELQCKPICLIKNGLLWTQFKSLDFPYLRI
jgi:hypothetical protein